MNSHPYVVAVSSSSEHTFSKPNHDHIRLVRGIGVEGDAHAGKQVKHRFLAGIDSTKSNIRQVHLIHAELLDDLKEKGFTVLPGQLGENITTRRIDLLSLPRGTHLQIGKEALVEVTALRNPCHQIDEFQNGLLQALSPRDENGELAYIVGVMGVVLVGGEVHPCDGISVKLPPAPHEPLQYVW